MSIIDKLKNLGRRLIGKEQVPLNMTTDKGPYYPSTSRERKHEARVNVKYAYVSVPIEQTPKLLIEQAAQLGIVLPERTLGKSTGPASSSNGYMKAQADGIAASTGMNNKQRCKLRSQIKRRAAELRAA